MMVKLAHRPRLQYFFSISATLIAVGIQYFIVMDTNIAVPGLLYPITFLIAWYFGFRHALISIFIGLILSNFLFFEPRFSLKVLQTEDGVRLIVFAITSLFCAWIVARGRIAQIGESKIRTELDNLQERFTKSSAATNLGIWYWELNSNELSWNKEAREHFWVSENEQVTIDTFYERLHPDDRELVSKAVDDSINFNAPYDMTYRTTDPKNPSNIKYIRAIGWTEYDLNNNPVRFDGITIDSTQLHRIEAERNESLEVVETLYRIGKTMSAELDQNKLAQQITDAVTQISKADFGIFYYSDELKNSATSGQPVEGYEKLSVPVVSRNGEKIGELILGHKQPGKFNEKIERIVTGIASQAAVAMDNARLFEKARQAVEIRDEFMSISSHELRTPLTPLKMQIQGLARLIKSGKLMALPEEKLLNMIDTADKQVNRLTYLVDDLLDVSRITTGKFTLNIEEVDVIAVIKEITERYHPQLQSAKCGLQLDLADSLIMNLDRLRLEQILINLITNAIKYAAGSPVKISAHAVNNQAVIKVADQGPGISEADQKRIFNRFERVTTETTQAGLGLGLYIVNQIVQAHGGTVKVESSEGKGTTFTIILPIKK